MSAPADTARGAVLAVAVDRLTAAGVPSPAYDASELLAAGS